MKPLIMVILLCIITSCSNVHNKLIQEDIKKSSTQPIKSSSAQREQISIDENDSTDLDEEEQEMPIPEKIKKPEFTNLFSNQEYKNTFSDVLISINTAGMVPVKDLILQIAKTADLNISIEQDIAQRVAVKIDNQPARTVIKSITKSSNLNYSEDGAVIYISNDRPRTKEYKVNTINTSCATEPDAECSNEEELKSIEENIKFIIKQNESISAEIQRTSINHRAGLLLVSAVEKTHKIIEEYINKLHSVMNLQAIIDVRMVQINMNKDDRSYLLKKYSEAGIIKTGADEDMDTIIQDLKSHGLAEVILSSKIRASNNKLSKIELVKKSDDNNEILTNILLSVRPVIDPIYGTVSVHIIPIFYESKQDVNEQVSSEEVLQSQKTNSVVSVHSNEIAVLSGTLTSQRIKLNPNLSLKNSKNQNKKLSETIIFLKATIVEPYASTLEKKEKNIYKKSSSKYNSTTKMHHASY